MKISHRVSLAGGAALLLLLGLAGVALAGDGAGAPPLGLLLAGVFVAGLALNLTPCVYPLIPITVSFFAGRGGGKAGALAQATVYLSGLVASYAGLGSLAALTGSMFGEALAHPLVLIAITAFILLMAASQFGLWEFRLPSRVTTMAAAERAGYLGAFIMGLTAGVLAVSCVAPVVGGLLAEVARVGQVWYGVLLFGVLALGLGLPLSVLAFFSEAASRLPAAGDWMLWVKKFFGWVLVGAALYVMMPLIGESAFRWGIFILALAAGVHLGVLDKSGKGRFVLAKRAVAVAVALAGVVYISYTWPAAPGQGAAIPWKMAELKTLAQDMEAAQKAGKPVALDFTAEWCAYCRKMDATTYRDPKVVGIMQKFVPMKVDVTQQTPEKRQFMAALGVRGLPTVVFVNPLGVPMPELSLAGYRDANTMAMWLKLVLAKSEEAKRNAAKPKPAS